MNQSTTLSVVGTVLALLLATNFHAVESQELHLTSEEAVVINQIRELSNAGLRGRPPEESDADHETFLSLLTDLGNSLGPQRLSQIEIARDYGFMHALAAIAIDRSQYPERYQEILDYYTPRANGDRYDPVALVPRSLDKRHISGEFRLVWELLLLESRSAATTLLHARPIVTEALSAIGDQRSVPVLIAATLATCDDGVPQIGVTMGRRVELLRTLSGFASQTTLNGILTILDTCTGTAAGKKLGGSTTREWVERLIVNQPNSAKRNAWRKVLEVYPKENLSRDNKQLIKSALRKHDR